MADLYILTTTDPEYAGNGNCKAYAKQADATKAGKASKKKGHSYEVEKVVTPALPLRDLCCALFNRDGWVGEVTTIEKWDAPTA